MRYAYPATASSPTRAEPYLRYLNHKMKRQALIPIDEGSTS